jgi:hypothetical protein
MSLKYLALIPLLFIAGLPADLTYGGASNDPLLRGERREVAKTADEKTEPPPSKANNKESHPIESVQSVIEKNIFSPERKEFTLPQAAGADSPAKPKARPQIVLFGITLAGDYQSASLIQSGRSLKKGERELMTVKVGDRIADYKIAKILTDKILLESEADQFEVLLYDPRTPKRRMDVRTETKPASVITAGASSATPTEVKREAEAPRESILPSPTPAPTIPSRRPSRREGLQETRDPSRERGAQVESPSTIAPMPSTPPGMPPPATPMPIPMTPTPIPIPPGMGTPLPPPSQ